MPIVSSNYIRRFLSIFNESPTLETARAASPREGSLGYGFIIAFDDQFELTKYSVPQIRVQILPDCKGVTAQVHFSEVQLSTETVKVFADVLSRVASAFGGISGGPISRLRLCTSTEAKLIYDGVFAYKEGCSAISVGDAFLRVMQQFPDRLAISNADGSSTMSYSQLEKASMAFAQWLLQQDRVEPGKVIGILYQPNAYLVIVYLACLRAGCAYTVSTEINQLEDVRTTYAMYGISDDRRVNA